MSTGFGDNDSTGTLEEYVELSKADDNLFWRMACGHHQNLLDEALERLGLT